MWGKWFWCWLPLGRQILHIYLSSQNVVNYLYTISMKVVGGVCTFFFMIYPCLKHGRKWKLECPNVPPPLVNTKATILKLLEVKKYKNIQLIVLFTGYQHCWDCWHGQEDSHGCLPGWVRNWARNEVFVNIEAQQKDKTKFTPQQTKPNLSCEI